MRIKNNLFPYPVLNAKETLSSFNNSIFNFDYIENQDSEYYYLNNVHLNLSDNNLQELILTNKASARMVVECSRTLYRSVFDVGLDDKNIKIPIGYLRGPVEISCFIIANENINEYYSESFNSIYGNYKFNIDKYDILAIDDGYNTKVDFDESKDNKVASIFLVVSNADETATTMDIEIKSKNIKISLPAKQYGYYTNMKNDSNYQNIFFSILAIPALSYALTKIQEEDFETARLKYDWLESVVNAYKNIYNKDLEEEWGKLDCDVSQRLLNDAVTKSIDDFYFLMIDRYRNGGDNDE